MANYRRDRINDEMMKEMNVIMRNVKDPRVSDHFVTVTAVEVSGDLKYAKVWYSALTGEEKEIRQGLRAATGYIRSCLARSLNLRITPELTFARDASIAHGAKIAGILSRITYSEDQDSAAETEANADGEQKKTELSGNAEEDTHV